MKDDVQGKSNTQMDGMQQSARMLPKWQRPILTFLGKVKDMVLGGGKTGWTADSDPQGTFNTGRKPN